MNITSEHGSIFLELNAHRALIKKLEKTRQKEEYSLTESSIIIPLNDYALPVEDEPRGIIMSIEEGKRISEMLGEFADYILHEENPEYAPPGKARVFIAENPPGYTVNCPFCGQKEEYFIGINEHVFPETCSNCNARVAAEMFGEDLPLTLMEILGENYTTKEHENFTEYCSSEGTVRAVVIEEPYDPIEDESYLLFIK